MDINSRTPTLGCSLIQDYIREAFCLHSIPCNLGKGQNGNHHLQWPKNKWGSHPDGDLVYRWGGGGNLGMVTTFCHHNQAKMEPSDAFSALWQCDLLEPSVVLVRRYTNTPYIPQGSYLLPYLDGSTFPEGTSSTQFPLDWLHLHTLLPLSDTEVVLP